jgi:hypothetical protein
MTTVFIIRDKVRGYGAANGHYDTREEAEANLWRYSGRMEHPVVEEVPLWSVQ